MSSHFKGNGMAMKLAKGTLTKIATIALALLFVLPAGVAAQSISEKSVQKRNEMIGYLRLMRPMVFNFPCEPFPECNVPRVEGDRNPTEDKPRLLQYRRALRAYQEGMVFHFERDFVNAYGRFLESQKLIEDLMEEVSQTYLDRTEIMMREAIERRFEEDPDDMSVVEGAMDLGPNSELRKIFQMPREPAITDRRYSPRRHHFVDQRYRIEENVRMGYQHLSIAREARQRALNLDMTRGGEPHEKLADPAVRERRIHFYLRTVEYARKAKLNAAYLFQLRYPYENYALQNPTGTTEETEHRPEPQVAQIDGVEMTWSENPYVIPRHLNPVFDLRFPDHYRVDVVDAYNRRYTDELEVYIHFKYTENKPEGFKPAEGQEGN